jgi:hypothetical protein
MEDQILAEISELRKALTQLIGTSDLSRDKQFSSEALDKAAKEFRALNSLQGQWIGEYDFQPYFPGCKPGTGKFIRDEFEFSNWYSRENSVSYNKKDIMALSKELKSRNVDLLEYMRLKKDQAQFHNKIESAALRKKAKNKKDPYIVADDLRDIKNHRLLFSGERRGEPGHTGFDAAI